ncbi:ketoacyl-ACP synthase III [Ligilactobacillus equi]|uniref:beta-ketoacyl-ACP synthase III n=1 Tax=Ligilactobacillus equi TaxID=137357 RepID=UPI002ED33A84
MKKIKFRASSHYVPEKIVTNDDLAQIMDTSDEWIQKRTGIKQRHISQGENTADLSVKVALDLLAKSGLSAKEIDLIIVATMSPEAYTPSTAALVQGEIGASKAFAFDISAACSGYIYALEMASAYLASGQAKRVMVLGGEVLSKIIDWQDRATAVLFGDGAGGAILEIDPDGTSAFLASDLATYGQDGQSLTAGITPALTSFPANGEHKFSSFAMDGHAVYSFATREVPKSIQRACDKAQLAVSDIDYFVLHQANARIIKSVAKKMQLPIEKFPINIDRYGNTSAASEPILFDELVQAGKIKPGSLVALSGFGGGLTVGTQIIRY